MTVRLPDFSSSKAWRALRNKMGADETYIMPKQDIDKISLDEIRKLQSGSISIDNIKDFINPIDNTFDFKGQKVILYIKQQKVDIIEFKYPNYKYHLAFCSTLRWMEEERRFKSRYVVTQRTDGKFLIDIIDRISGKYHFEDKLYELDVCKNCLKHLSSKYPNDKSFCFDMYDLNNFLKKYNTQHVKKPIHRPNSIPKDEYSSDWRIISGNLKKESNYRCSDCNHDLSNQKHLLHVHHKDGVKWNNKRDNLEVLCYDCHRKKPGHSKMSYKKVG